MATLAIPPPINPAITSLTSSTTTTTSPSTNLPLPRIFRHWSTPPRLITQGAEALLYRSTFLHPSRPSALKYRPSKPYRHPILDARLTKHRILSEARVLLKLQREGVCVPAVYSLDKEAGWLMLEWVEGEVVRVRVNDWLALRKERGDELLGLLGRMGEAVGRMHAAGIIHGDLTTSNLMLRPTATTKSASGDKLLDGEIVIIDFGLASQSSADEDRAVDLYVLERAFGSTHPRAEGLFEGLLAAYRTSYKGGSVVIKKLEDVRMRGRKRSMLG